MNAHPETGPRAPITPPDETTMTIERRPGGTWLLTVEQGNGDETGTLKLTETEYTYLGLMMGRGWPHSFTFTDKTR